MTTHIKLSRLYRNMHNHEENICHCPDTVCLHNIIDSLLWQIYTLKICLSNINSWAQHFIVSFVIRDRVQCLRAHNCIRFKFIPSTQVGRLIATCNWDLGLSNSTGLSVCMFVCMCEYVHVCVCVYFHPHSHTNNL